MATFVERAVLEIITRGEDKLAHLNAELAKLQKTAQALAKGDLFKGQGAAKDKVDALGASAKSAVDPLKNVNAQMARLGRSTNAEQVAKVGTGMSAAARAATALAREIRNIDRAQQRLQARGQFNGFNPAVTGSQVAASQIRGAQRFIEREYGEALARSARTMAQAASAASREIAREINANAERIRAAGANAAQAAASSSVLAAGLPRPAAPPPPGALPPPLVGRPAALPPPRANESPAVYAARLEAYQARQDRLRVGAGLQPRAQIRGPAGGATISETAGQIATAVAQQARIENEKKENKQAASGYGAAVATGAIVKASLDQSKRKLTPEEHLAAGSAAIDKQSASHINRVNDADAKLEQARRDRINRAQAHQEAIVREADKKAELDKRLSEGRGIKQAEREALSAENARKTKEAAFGKANGSVGMAEAAADRARAGAENFKTHEEPLKRERAQQQYDKRVAVEAKSGGGGGAEPPGGGGGEGKPRFFRRLTSEAGTYARYRAFAAGGHAVHGAFDSVKDIDNERSLLALNGYTPEEIAAVEQMANRSTEKFMGTTKANAIENAREGALLLHDDPNKGASGQRIAEQQAKAVAMLTMGTRDPKKAASMSRFLNRAIEQAIHPEDGENSSVTADNYIAKSDAALQGILSGNAQLQNPSQIFSNWRRTGIATRMLTGDGIVKLMHMNVERGGEAGADVKTTLADLVRTTLNPTSTGQMIKSGLRDKEGKAIPALVKEFGEDPYAASAKHLKPKLKAMGIDLNDDAAVAVGLQQLGFTPRASFLPQLSISQEAILDNVAKQAKKVIKDPKAVQAEAEKNLTYGQDAVSKQFNELIDRWTQPLQKKLAQLESDIARELKHTSNPDLDQNTNSPRRRADATPVKDMTIGAGAIGGAALLGLYGWMKDNPGTSAQIGAAAALTGAAGALAGSAGALTSAAAFQRGTGLLGGVAGVAKGGIALAAAAAVAVAMEEWSNRQLNDKGGKTRLEDEINNPPPGIDPGKQAMRKLVGGAAGIGKDEPEWGTDAYIEKLEKQMDDRADDAIEARMKADEERNRPKTSDFQAPRARGGYLFGFIQPAYADGAPDPSDAMPSNMPPRPIVAGGGPETRTADDSFSGAADAIMQAMQGGGEYAGQSITAGMTEAVAGFTDAGQTLATELAGALTDGAGVMVNGITAAMQDGGEALSDKIASGCDTGGASIAAAIAGALAAGISVNVSGGGVGSNTGTNQSRGP
jgi:hypothetical protein